MLLPCGFSQGNSIYFLDVDTSARIEAGDENGNQEAARKRERGKRSTASMGKPTAQAGGYIDYRVMFRDMPRRRL